VHDEIEMMDRQMLAHPIETLERVVEVDGLLAAQRAVRQVRVSDELKRYILHLVSATRNHPEIYLGASPRGTLALVRTAQARAAILGRSFLLPDDIKAVAVPALAHRLIMGSSARVREIDTRVLVGEILSSVPVPGGEVG
jgi:MoxR-like ATPase